jgi:hypothetical protein
MLTEYREHGTQEPAQSDNCCPHALVLPVSQTGFTEYRIPWNPCFDPDALDLISGRFFIDPPSTLRFDRWFFGIGCSDRHCVGGGVSPAVRDRDQDIADPSTDRFFLRSSADEDAGLSFLALADLDVGPGDTSAPAGPKRFQDRLFRGPESREMLDRVLSRLAITDLAVGVNPAKKEFAVVLYHLADPWALDDVRTDPEDIHEFPAFDPKTRQNLDLSILERFTLATRPEKGDWLAARYDFLEIPGGIQGPGASLLFPFATRV